VAAGETSSPSLAAATIIIVVLTTSLASRSYYDLSSQQQLLDAIPTVKYDTSSSSTFTIIIAINQYMALLLVPLSLILQTGPPITELRLLLGVTS
jgi:hypothetical protein